MFEAIEFTLDDGATIAVAPTARAGSGAVGLDDRLESATKTLREALAPVTTAAGQVMDDFRKLAQRPDEVEIAFGVVLDSKLGGVIASAKAGAHLEITLRWRATPAAAPNGGGDG